MADTGFNLQGTMAVSLEIDGKQLPAVQGIIKSYFIQAGFGIDVPAAKLAFSDKNKILTGDLSINDGTKIKLYLGKDGLTKVFNFRVISKRALDTPNGQEIDVVAAFDVPAYMLGAQSESYRGNSVDVISQVLGKSGVSVDSDIASNDSMTWLNVGRSRSALVKDIIRHSYINDNTILMGMYDVNNVFQIADMFKRIQGEPEYTIFSGATAEFSTEPEKTFMASETKPSQDSGLTNALLNYGTVRVDNSMSGKTTRDNKVNPPVMGDGLPINQNMRDSVEYTRMDYSLHHDPGVGDLAASNAHKNYHTAPNRNDRYLALFNQGVEVMIDGDASIPLLSCVNFQPYKQIGKDTILDTSQAGNYLVGGVTLIGNSHYYSERYSLYRCYVSDSGSTPVLGSRNQEVSTGKPKANAVASSTSNFDDPTNSAEMTRQASPDIQGLQDTDGTVKSPLDTVIDKANISVQELSDSFKLESSTYDVDWLTEKYGTSTDKLDALMNEVSSAKQLLSTCKKPSFLEKLSLEFAILNIGSIFSALASRLDAVDNLYDSIMSSINDLITSGAISTSLTSPNLNTNCKDLNTDHINAAINDKFPNKCLSMNAAKGMNIPLKALDKIRRALEESLRDLTCLMEK